MISVAVEDQKLTIEEKEELIKTSINIEKDRYIIDNEVAKHTLSDFYKYEDYDLFVNIQTLFNEKYLNFILYNGETNKGYKLLGINGSLEVQVKRLLPETFVVVGKNKEVEDYGQVSFCNLVPSGEVNEIVLNFNKLKQVVFVGKRFVILNYYEIIESAGKKEYLYTVCIHKAVGNIEKVLVDEKAKSYIDYSFEVKGGVVFVYKKSKGEKVEVAKYSVKAKNE